MWPVPGSDVKRNLMLVRQCDRAPPEGTPRPQYCHIDRYPKGRQKPTDEQRRHSQPRMLRLMRVHGLLASTRAGDVHGDPAHAGRIRTDRPNELWGTDATCFWTERDGWCWFFGGDHGDVPRALSACPEHPHYERARSATLGLHQRLQVELN